MSYEDFKKDYLATTADLNERQAELWNLEHENRVPAEVKTFQEALGGSHTQAIHGGSRPEDAATDSMSLHVRGIREQPARWTGLIPGSDSSSIPPEVVTYKPAFSVQRYRQMTAFDPANPSREVRIQGFLDRTESVSSLGWPRFLWVTFEGGGRSLPRDDPTDVKRELGLAHFRQGDFVYRFNLPLARDKDRFVPTCFDAELYAAWKPPSADHAFPWGLTRDLTNGQSRWPELLVERSDYADRPLKANLVSASGTRSGIGVVVVDFMIGR